MTELEKIEAEIFALQNERKALFKQKEPIDKRIVEIANSLGPLSNQRDLLHIAAMNDAPDWKMMIEDCGGNDRGSMELLRYFRKQLEDRFSMWHSGYWVDTLQTCIQLKVGNTDESARNLAGVKFFLPLLKPHALDGRVWFGVFEHTLGAHGTYMLKADPDGSEWCLVKTTYGYDTVISTWKTPEDAVAYIRRYHWYGERVDSD